MLQDTENMADNYVYEPLDLAKDSLRLLRLCKGYPLDEIRCELHQSLLSDSEGVPYEALSYSWGSKLTNDSPRVLIGDHKVPQDNSILSVRHQDMMALWDKKFKALPQRVQSWEKAYSTNYKWYEGLNYAIYRGHKATFSRLMERAWFKRVWIIQEVANARVALIMCGTKSVASRTFSMMHRLMHLQPHPHTREVMEVMPGPLRNQSWWTTDRRLITLLIKFHGSEATQEHDRIYALLGIASDAPVIPIDYGCPFQHVVNRTLSLLTMGDVRWSQLLENGQPLLFDAVFQDVAHPRELPIRVLELALDHSEWALIKDLFDTPNFRTIIHEAFSNGNSGSRYLRSLFNLHTRADLRDCFSLAETYLYAAYRKHYFVCNDISEMDEFKPTNQELLSCLKTGPSSLAQTFVRRKSNLIAIYEYALGRRNYSLCNDVSEMPEFKADHDFIMRLFEEEYNCPQDVPDIPDSQLQKIVKQGCDGKPKELYKLLQILVKRIEEGEWYHLQRAFLDEFVRSGIISLHGKDWARAAVQDSNARSFLAFLLENLKKANIEGLPSFATDIIRWLSYSPVFSSVEVATLNTLIDCGADIEVFSPTWGTPLRQAIGKSCHWLVRILAKRGADLSSRDESGRTPLHYAESLDDDKDSSRPPEYRPAVIAILLLHGANEWAEDRDGRTPWQLNQENLWGMKRRNKEQVQELISAVAPSKQYLFEGLLEGR
ncbi:HET-domain-containing protein [Apiospora arundinis]